MRTVKEFAVYKGDEFLFIGTAKECAAELGIKEASFRFYLTPSYQRRISNRNSKNPIFVVDLDKSDD